MTGKTADLPRFTEPQREALNWLPYDGTWTVRKTGRLSAAMKSLLFYHPELAHEEWGDFGPRGGRCRRLRLTEKGVRVAEAINADQS